MSTHALPGRLSAARAALHRQQLGSAIARTACFNVAAAATAALGSVILARTLGPTVRGEYAAVTSWFGVLLIVGQAGQTAAVCFYVARDPQRARGYVATSRAMMLVTGAVALVCGLLAAPVLAHSNSALADVYRLIFAGSVLGFLGGSYTSSLQAGSIRRWNLARLSQPAFGLAGIVLLWRLRLLSLNTVIVVLMVSTTIQLGYAYYWCRRSELAPGHFRPELVMPLVRYGVTQLTAVAPATVNAYLDQLVLSQIVPPADLGRYAIAVSITLLPVPAVSAIGNVAFPRLAAQRTVSADSHRLQRAAMLTSAGAASAILLPVAAIAHWLVPFVFGPGYQGAVPLLWILTPGGVFLACGQVAGDLLRGLGRPGLVAAAQGLAAIFTVILLIALLPVAGVAGAAIASTVAYGVALAVMIRSLWRPAFRPLVRTKQPPQAGDHGTGEREASITECPTASRTENTWGVSMTIRELVRPLPGVRQISLLRQRLTFTGSAHYWEQNYAQGATSGAGSFGTLGKGKSRFLNNLIRERSVGDIIEFGCGDGYQLAMADYPSYIGLDVSRTAIGLCQQRFADDPAKSFFLYDGSCFTDRAGLFTADLALSLDVVYHLTEDTVFETYLRHLFAAGQRLVVIYSTNMETSDTAPHVRHRRFTPWVEANCPGWTLTEVTRGPNTDYARADFFVYERA